MAALLSITGIGGILIFLKCLLSTIFPFLFRSTDTAARSQLNIFGVNQISINQTPYFGFYRPLNGDYFCGAVIVNENFVLTAASCYNPNDTMRVTVGTETGEGGEDYDIEETFVHPEYKTDDFLITHDIAVLKLKKKLEFNDRVQNIKMADSNTKIKDGEQLMVLGISLDENNLLPPKLQSVIEPYVNQRECSDNYNRADITSFVCAGGKEGQSLCLYAGGLLVNIDEVLVGIATQTNENCGSAGSPVVFTSIQKYRVFIDEVIENNA